MALSFARTTAFRVDLFNRLHGLRCHLPSESCGSGSSSSPHYFINGVFPAFGICRPCRVVLLTDEPVSSLPLFTNSSTASRVGDLSVPSEQGDRARRCAVFQTFSRARWVSGSSSPLLALIAPQFRGSAPFPFAFLGWVVSLILLALYYPFALIAHALLFFSLERSRAGQNFLHDSPYVSPGSTRIGRHHPGRCSRGCPSGPTEKSHRPSHSLWF